MKALLQVENLKKYFPVRRGFLSRHHAVIQAVDGISFAIHQGETLGLVGESGSGKSTIARCIMRLTEVTKGRILFQDQDISTMGRKALRPFRKRIQIIFQNPYSSLNPRMTVSQIIGDVLRHNTRMGAKEKKERILAIMDMVGLRPEHYNRYPHEFSGGQRQRIGIARAIIPNPELVVADEPLSALDVSIQAQVVNLLDRLKKELQLSYLFISHDLSVVEHISDRIAVMYLGKIVELATKDQLYYNPRHPYTIALLSAVPLPEIGPKKRRIVLKGDIPSPLAPPKGCRFHTRCFRAMDICAEMEPSWKNLGDGHYTACHLY